MEFKTQQAKIKAAGVADGLEEGQFTALVSVFNNVDSYGDVVQPGAFTDTIAEWKASGNPIPVYYSHRMDDPDYNIGHVVESKETDTGLWVKVQLDLSAPSTSKAAQTYQLLKGGRLTQFSFAYDVIDGGFETKDEEEFFAIRKVKLYEVGPTPIGANDATELIAVKSMIDARAAVLLRKAGRVLSSKNETALKNAQTQLVAAAEQIANVLSAIESAQEEDSQKSDHAQRPAKEIEPDQPSPAVPSASEPSTDVHTTSVYDPDLASLYITTLERELA